MPSAVRYDIGSCKQKWICKELRYSAFSEKKGGGLSSLMSCSIPFFPIYAILLYKLYIQLEVWKVCHYPRHILITAQSLKSLYWTDLLSLSHEIFCCSCVLCITSNSYLNSNFNMWNKTFQYNQYTIVHVAIMRLHRYSLPVDAKAIKFSLIELCFMQCTTHYLHTMVIPHL